MEYYSLDSNVIDITEQIFVNDGVSIKNTITLTVRQDPKEPKKAWILSFPWGEGFGELAGMQAGDWINCAVLTDGYRADALEDGQGGIYWLITGILSGWEDIRIRFDGIISRTAGITCLNIRAVPLSSVVKETQTRIPIFKRRPEFGIRSFLAADCTVKPGTKVCLSWNVTGASRCILEPGNIPVNAVGSQEFLINRETVFVLRAIRGRRSEDRELTVYCKNNEKGENKL